jgi:hypothetical protein
MIVTKEERFWEWFKINNSRYFYLNQIGSSEKKEKLLNEFLEHLHEYCDKLYFEIGGFPNEPQELIISAEGNKDYFDKVEELISKAPKINDWQIIPFKPPMGTDFVTEYEDVVLDPKKIWFLPLDNKNNPRALGLKMYLPNYIPKKEKTFLEGCYQVLDTILGEKSSTLDIAHLELAKLPTRPEKEGLIELSELAKYIEWRKTKV